MIKWVIEDERATKSWEWLNILIRLSSCQCQFVPNLNSTFDQTDLFPKCEIIFFVRFGVFSKKFRQNLNFSSSSDSSKLPKSFKSSFHFKACVKAFPWYFSSIFILFSLKSSFSLSLETGPCARLMEVHKHIFHLLPPLHCKNYSHHICAKHFLWHRKKNCFPSISSHANDN